jgi:hypothetical protein
LLFDRLFEAAALLYDLLRPLLVIPEIRLSDLRFELCYFFFFCRRVKETSRVGKLFPLSVQICFSVRSVP